jgi:hypothetical protein
VCTWNRSTLHLAATTNDTIDRRAIKWTFYRERTSSPTFASFKRDTRHANCPSAALPRSGGIHGSRDVSLNCHLLFAFFVVQAGKESSRSHIVLCSGNEFMSQNMKSETNELSVPCILIEMSS